MIHWELLCRNWLTGRTAWALRYIPDGEYGDPYEWSLVVIKPTWLSRHAEVSLVQGMSMYKRKMISSEILGNGFTSATSLRHGKKVRWVR